MLKFERLSESELMTILQQNGIKQNSWIETVIRLSNGSAKKALEIVQNEDYYKIREMVLSSFKKDINFNRSTVIQFVTSNSERMTAFMELMQLILRDLLILKYGMAESLCKNIDIIDELRKLSHDIGKFLLMRFYNSIGFLRVAAEIPLNYATLISWFMQEVKNEV